jgi:16S rRNA (cytidine1402-2'-O)-methyltransferase
MAHSDSYGKLYLIPVFLSETPIQRVFPPVNTEILNELDFFIVEHEKNARRFIKKLLPHKAQSGLHFFILNKHTAADEIAGFIAPLLRGKNMGLMSDAGMPAIADPGNAVVALAHDAGVEVVPLVGPSSIFLALTASGLNGQHFEFHGYLPVKTGPLKQKIKEIRNDILRSGKTHIFIETPYRNGRLLDFLLQNLPDEIKICIAVDLTGPAQKILTRTVGQWKKNKLPFDIHKIPAVFLLGK